MPDFAPSLPPPPSAPSPTNIDVGINPDASGQPTITWTNRRRMAWLAFYVICGAFIITLYAALWLARTDRQLALLESLYSYLAMTCASVILGYMGFTSIPFWGKGK